jgi:dienelactone hydrolase
MHTFWRPVADCDLLYLSERPCLNWRIASSKALGPFEEVGMAAISQTRTVLLTAAIAALIALGLALWLLRPMARLGFVAFGPARPIGPLAVVDQDVTLPIPARSGGRTINVAIHVWYPVAAQGQPYPLILYAPVWAAHRLDNRAFAAGLASHGYVVVAMDDVIYDPDAGDGSAEDAYARKTLLDFTSDAGRERMLSSFDRRLELNAAKASAILDVLVRDQSRLPKQAKFDPQRVGMAGASFGGATAVEVAGRDPRILAVANLDGWLRGRAQMQALPVALLNFNSTRGAPDPAARQRSDANPNHAFLAARSAETAQILSRELAAEQGAIDITIAGASHGDFNDELYDNLRWLQWRPWRSAMIAPEQMRRIVDTYTAAFFDVHLQGISAPLLSHNASRFPEAKIKLGRPRRSG